MNVSETEKNFLEFCRKMGYAAGQLYIMDGTPKKMENPVKSVRFDLLREDEDDSPLTDDTDKR